jgi:hypothetical protein
MLELHDARKLTKDIPKRYKTNPILLHVDAAKYASDGSCQVPQRACPIVGRRHDSCALNLQLCLTCRLFLLSGITRRASFGFQDDGCVDLHSRKPFLLSGHEDEELAAVSTSLARAPQPSTPPLPSCQTLDSVHGSVVDEMRLDVDDDRSGMPANKTFSNPILSDCTFSSACSIHFYSFLSMIPPPRHEQWSRFCRNSERGPPSARRLSSVGSAIGRSVVASYDQSNPSVSPLFKGMTEQRTVVQVGVVACGV